MLPIIVTTAVADNVPSMTADQKARGNVHDTVFHRMVVKMNERLLAKTDRERERMFRVNIDDLTGTYLGNFVSDAERAASNCRCCKNFLRMYGTVATVNEDTGKIESAIWFDDAEEQYAEPFRACKAAVESAKLRDFFRPTTEELQLDQSIGYSSPAHQWKHFKLTLPRYMITNFDRQGKDIGTAVESRDILERTVRLFPGNVLPQAIALLTANGSDQNKSFADALRWMVEFRTKLESVKGNSGAYNNLIWLAAATQPIGFTRSINGVLNEFLENIEKIGTERAWAIHAERTKGTKYQRAQAPAAEGNIRQGEKIIDKKGLTNSLLRRYLRPEEAVMYWTPAAPKAAGTGGVFDKLIPKGQTQAYKSEAELIKVPERRMTMVQFLEKILPTALKIELKANPGHGYIGMMTAVDPGAPPILKWDFEDQRNPVNWFFVEGMHDPRFYSLGTGQWTKVTGMCKMPPHWGRVPDGIEATANIFLLEGFRHIQPVTSCLFPQVLIADLFEVRSTIEQYSNATKVHSDVPTAGGFAYSKGDLHLRVTTEDSLLSIIIDRVE